MKSIWGLFCAALLTVSCGTDHDAKIKNRGNGRPGDPTQKPNATEARQIELLSRTAIAGMMEVKRLLPYVAQFAFPSQSSDCPFSNFDAQNPNLDGHTLKQSITWVCRRDHGALPSLFGEELAIINLNPTSGADQAYRDKDVLSAQIYTGEVLTLTLRKDQSSLELPYSYDFRAQSRPDHSWLVQLNQAWIFARSRNSVNWTVKLRGQMNPQFNQWLQLHVDVTRTVSGGGAPTTFEALTLEKDSSNLQANACGLVSGELKLINYRRSTSKRSFNGTVQSSTDGYSGFDRETPWEACPDGGSAFIVNINKILSGEF